MVKSMECVDFWHHKGFQESKRTKSYYSAMDYYRQGLRKFPNDHVLIYSLAVCYCKLKKF